MNIAELRNKSTQKIASFPENKLKIVASLLEQIDSNQDYSEEENKTIEKWQFLLNKNKDLDEVQTLYDQEIKVICQILSKESKKRPVGLAKG